MTTIGYLDAFKAGWDSFGDSTKAMNTYPPMTQEFRDFVLGYKACKAFEDFNKSLPKEDNSIDSLLLFR